MILGNTHDETSTAAAGPTGELTWQQAPEALRASVSQYLGSYTPEEVIRFYRGLYPDLAPGRLVVAAAVAFRAWPGQVLEADRRAGLTAAAEQHPAPPNTWVYRMDWPSPFPGHWAQHTIDIPFFFDNCAFAPGMVGATPEDLARAQPLATAMSGMLIRYAATGDPQRPRHPRLARLHRTRSQNLDLERPVPRRSRPPRSGAALCRRRSLPPTRHLTPPHPQTCQVPGQPKSYQTQRIKLAEYPPRKAHT